ncbi:MAG: molybdopterin-dependent oxidoreductase, partial [Campylobacterota bacterium]|nr:molybdopterin-dependent oxidoreductase [Campylobacterota bacterium]
EKTGIDAATIERIAWEFAKDAPNVVAMPPRRMTRYANDTQTVRAIAIINALMGSWGVPGGIFYRTKAPLDLPKYDHPHLPTVRRADEAGKGEKYSFAPTNLGLTNGIYRATLTQKPYPIKAWLMYGTNPVGHSAVGENKLFDAMDNLDLIISIDTQFTGTVNYSDIVLPESTYLERDDAPYVSKDKVPFVALRKAAIAPIYDTKGCFEICEGIAKKFGVEKYFKNSPQKQMDDLIATLDDNQKERLEKDGTLLFDDVDPYPFASGGTPKFPTSTGKAQLYSPDLDEAFAQFGDEFSPMPIYKDPIMPKSDEFRLLFGRTPHHSHGRTQSNSALLELQDSSPIWMHPDDAQKLGFEDGQMVKLLNTKTQYKSKFEKLKVTKRIKSGCVFVHYGFGKTSKQMNNKGIDTQYFVSNEIDPISGAAAFHNGFVKVVKG